MCPSYTPDLFETATVAIPCALLVVLIMWLQSIKPRGRYTWKEETTEEWIVDTDERRRQSRKKMKDWFWRKLKR